MSRSAPHRARAAAALLSLALAGCATLEPGAGVDAVREVAQQRLGQMPEHPRTAAQADAVARRVAELLARPLSADAAVQLALLNHRGLQAAFEDLGIAEAERVQALRLPNPGFSIGRARSGDERETEWSLHLALARLLTLPAEREAQAQRLQQLQAAVALQVLAHAADTRRAWVQAVAAEQTVRYARQVLDAAEAGAELARRMAAAGNFNKLQRAREQGFYADAALGLARAQQAQRAARERLTRLLGLWGAQIAYTLPERLPALPAEPAERPQLEREALAQRLDVRATRQAVDESARRIGIERVTRWVPVFELGLTGARSDDGHRSRSVEIGFELPLFDSGDARQARAEAVHRRAVHRAAQVAVDARSEVREAYGAWRTAWDIARHHRDEIVPLRRQIADENLLRYNGMLIGVFELLADARAQVAAVHGSIEALRDFWLADADLRMALVGRPQLASAATPSLAAPAADPGGH
jgi:outer membrane protein TolC